MLFGVFVIFFLFLFDSALTSSLLLLLLFFFLHFSYSVVVGYTWRSLWLKALIYLYTHTYEASARVCKKCLISMFCVLSIFVSNGGVDVSTLASRLWILVWVLNEIRRSTVALRIEVHLNAEHISHVYHNVLLTCIPFALIWTFVCVYAVCENALREFRSFYIIWSDSVMMIQMKDKTSTV